MGGVSILRSKKENRVRRLTEKQREDILRDYDAKVKTEVIAERHGVDPSYPSILARRRDKKMRWKARRRRKWSREVKTRQQRQRRRARAASAQLSSDNS